MDSHRCLIMGSILTAVIMLFVGACAGLSGTAVKQCPEVSPSPDLTNNEVRKIPQSASYVPGEVLVRFAEDADEETIAAIEKKYYVTVKKVLIPARLYLMKITDDSTVQDILDRLLNNKAIEYAEPNYLRQTR